MSDMATASSSPSPSSTSTPSPLLSPASAAAPRAGHLLLYSYWRSGSAWRVRLALQLKGLSYVCQPIDLLSGEQQRAEYARLNPSCAVPTLVVSFDETEQRLVIGQSNAILEWLEETHPQPCPLLPAEANSRAKVRQLVALLVADTQPLANLSVLDHVQQLTGSAEERKRWGRHWVVRGLTAFESLVSLCSGRYCFGDALSLADVVLVPQLFAARRFDVDLTAFPTCSRIEAELSALPAFKACYPDVVAPAVSRSVGYGTSGSAASGADDSSGPAGAESSAGSSGAAPVGAGRSPAEGARGGEQLPRTAL